MSTPLVSVVMPAYNHQHFVCSAVNSVLNQSHANLELIVIDDASQDDTWQVLQTIDDERLKLTKHETNQGAHYSLNEGLSLARGEYITIINSDDLFHPQRLELLLAAAVKTDADDFFAFSDVSFINQDGVLAPADERARNHWRLCRYCSRIRPELWFFVGNVAVSTSNFFFSKSLLEKVGDFSDLRYTHDWNWALRATAQVLPVWIHEDLLSYRIHQTNTLSEADNWRHIHENSYVQASALQTVAGRLDAGASDKARDVCIALLRNESLHPLALLYFLMYYLCGANEKLIQSLASAAEGHWIIPETAKLAGCPLELFSNLPHLVEMETVIASQAKLVEERWLAMEHMSAEINGRDKWIADLQKNVEQLRAEIARQHNQIEALIAELAIKHDALEGSYQELAVLNNELTNTKHELASLYASRLVRLALFLSHKVSLLRSLPARFRHRFN